MEIKIMQTIHFSFFGNNCLWKDLSIYLSIHSEHNSESLEFCAYRKAQTWLADL